MSEYKLLMLDFDGVLSNSLKVCAEEINRLVDSSFPSICKVYSQEDMTKIYSVQLRYSLYPFGLTADQTKKFFDLHSEAMKSRAKEVEPFSLVVSNLANCKLPKIIITSSYSEACQEILRKCEGYNNDLIQKIYGRENWETKTAKIEKALDFYNINLSDALYVGDMASDILYCKDVPVDIAAVGYGYHPAHYLQKFSPTYTLETEKQFVSFISNL